uniref:guanylate cyclase n=1 Tax=Chromera velia CCMP2878 TaxID=1169474 RepID=A0A0G4F9D4_9ALVE|eukprot:Cvel_2996.t1-p1 / transcript=Cvel_2996.t1 / gene=Cvel_2996 / organism=Chromera_velia_CCMP2878 / gene_product=Retinal guanylyl cyclase 1, putative / transcript_product=Retinal guanylyl cyclase 1, putative / location=Cvel_scaffold119:68820-85072(-) / protein_length=1180 / sequence_SO=supercontig / SO=protein_coding / is_pseudo=false
MLVQALTLEELQLRVQQLEEEHNAQLDQIRGNYELGFLLLASVLVLMLQAGFAFVEAGLVQPKHVAGMLLKNLMDMVVSLQHRLHRGASAGRVRLTSYLFLSALMMGLVWPLCNRWTKGAFPWMGDLGYRFYKLRDGIVRSRELHKASLEFFMLGSFVLIVGFQAFAFVNGVYGDFPLGHNLGRAMWNTLLGTSCGAAAVALQTQWTRGHLGLIEIFTGALGGCVAIGAGCPWYGMWASMLIGTVGGLLILPSNLLLLRLRIDDPVSAAGVHMISGMWGVIAEGIFGTEGSLIFTGNGEAFGAQVLGAVMLFVITAAFFLPACFLLKRFGGLRVHKEAEDRGLGIVEARVDLQNIGSNGMGNTYTKWRIDRSAVTFDNPPVMIARGNGRCSVVVADYRRMKVVVKSPLPRSAFLTCSADIQSNSEKKNNVEGVDVKGDSRSASFSPKPTKRTLRLQSRLESLSHGIDLKDIKALLDLEEGAAAGVGPALAAPIQPSLGLLEFDEEAEAEAEEAERPEALTAELVEQVVAQMRKEAEEQVPQCPSSLNETGEKGLSGVSRDKHETQQCQSVRLSSPMQSAGGLVSPPPLSPAVSSPVMLQLGEKRQQQRDSMNVSMSSKRERERPSIRMRRQISRGSGMLFGKSQSSKALSQVHAKLEPEVAALAYRLGNLEHPNLVTFLGGVIDSNQHSFLVFAFKTGGSLADLLGDASVPIDWPFVQKLMKEIVSGLRFLSHQDPPIFHNRLVASNVLFDDHMTAKLSDFLPCPSALDLIKKEREGQSGKTAVRINPETPASEETDILALACLILGVVTGQDLAWQRRDDIDFVIRGELEQNEKSQKEGKLTLPSDFVSLLQECTTNTDDPPSLELFENAVSTLDEEQMDKYLEQRQKELHPGRTNKRTTSQLLDQIFPPGIAEALRDGRKIDPLHRDEVTIFFSDIVGFTTIGSVLLPEEIMDMLDRLYRAFDELSGKHGVFKVETIGDAYVCVTNLVKKQKKDHTRRIAAFALEAIRVANQTVVHTEKPDLGTINIRVGFHVGPCVASVVGTANPRFCLFGDTVSTASRMESNSEKNRIHISESAERLLRQQAPEAQIEPRGRIPVKGKGEMCTFWVNALEGGRDGGNKLIRKGSNTHVKLKKPEIFLEKAEDVDTWIALWQNLYHIMKTPPEEQAPITVTYLSPTL